MRALCFTVSFLSRSYHDRQAALFLVAASIAMIGSSVGIRSVVAGIMCGLAGLGKEYLRPDCEAASHAIVAHAFRFPFARAVEAASHQGSAVVAMYELPSLNGTPRGHLACP